MQWKSTCDEDCRHAGSCCADVAGISALLRALSDSFCMFMSV